MLYTFQDGPPDSGWANLDRLNSFAFSLDMNIDEFNECMDSSKYKKRVKANYDEACLLYTSPSPRDQRGSRMPSSA